MEIKYFRGVALSLKNLGEAEAERGNFKNAGSYFLEAIPLFEKLSLLNELNWTRVELGYMLAVQCQYTDARNQLELSLSYARSVSDPLRESNSLRPLGNSYAQQGYYLKAFEHLQKAFLISKSSDDTSGNLLSPSMLGYLFLIAGDTTAALKYSKQSMDYAKSKGLKRSYYEIMADLYSMKKQYDSALFALAQFDQLIQAYDDDRTLQKRWLMFNAVYLAELSIKMENYRKAAASLWEPLEFFTQGNDVDQVLHILSCLGRAYVGQKNNEKALSYGRQLIVLAERTRNRKFMRDGYWLLWRTFDRLHNIDQAYRYLLKYTTLNDAIESDEHKRKIAAADWIVKIEEQQAQIDLLDRSNKIEQEQVQTQSLMKKIYAGSLIVFVLLSTIVFRNLTLKRKNERLLGEKKQEALQRQTYELEMQALRAQMSPHFIFNSLNSINRFILQNDTTEASDYLTKFSKLIRLILQNSSATLIPLESELESLELYLDLESLRFNDRLAYTISIGKDLDINALKVPPLVIQPYVENAIWHRLMHKEEKCQLDIELYQEEEQLLVKITDDGIGRTQASALASKSASRSKSMGLKITADRIALLQTSSRQASIVINDLIHPDGSAAGTEVIIKLPALYD